MSASRRVIAPRFCSAGLACLVFFAHAVPVQASDLKIEAKLVWGTNDEKYNNPRHKPVDEATAEKLRAFRWKHYFTVTNMVSSVGSRQTKRLKLSDPCEVEITELEGDRVTVQLFGQGKPVNRVTRGLKKGETTIIGGEDKNDSSWFIMISQLE